MTSVKGLGASLGVAIGSSFVYENEIDFNKKAVLTHVGGYRDLCNEAYFCARLEHSTAPWPKECQKGDARRDLVLKGR